MPYFPHPIGFLAPGLYSIVQQASATSTASTIAAPADILAGDLLVLLDRSTNSLSPAPSVIPTGFTSINDVNQGGFTSYRQIASYKLAASSDASSTLTGMNGNAGNLKALLVFRGNIAAKTLNVGSVAGSIQDTDPALQTVTSGSGSTPLVVFGGYGATGGVTPRTFSTTKDGEINPSTLLYLAWKIYNGAPANSDIDMTDILNGNALQSFYIQMA